jgi:HEAT repeat protein
MEQTPDERVNESGPGTDRSLDALEKFTAPIIEHLINALNSEDKWVRYLAADALGNMGDPRSIEHLLLLRSDKDPDLRFVSAQSFCKIGYTREVLANAQKRGCDSCLIRCIAEEALAQRNRTIVSTSYC